MSKNVKYTRRYEAKNPDYAGYMRLLSGARAFINPKLGTKGFERTKKFDRYTNDLADLKKIINKKLGGHGA
mgnify:CR=1 FL=1